MHTRAQMSHLFSDSHPCEKNKGLFTESKWMPYANTLYPGSTCNLTKELLCSESVSETDSVLLHMREGSFGQHPILILPTLKRVFTTEKTPIIRKEKIIYFTIVYCQNRFTKCFRVETNECRLKYSVDYNWKKIKPIFFCAWQTLTSPHLSTIKWQTHCSCQLWLIHIRSLREDVGVDDRSTLHLI